MKIDRLFHPPATIEPIDDPDAVGSDFRAAARQQAFDCFDRIRRRADVAMSFLEIGDDRGSRYCFAEMKGDFERIEKLLANIRSSLQGATPA